MKNAFSVLHPFKSLPLRWVNRGNSKLLCDKLNYKHNETAFNLLCSCFVSVTKF